jgi:hypothetical protein
VAPGDDLGLVLRAGEVFRVISGGRRRHRPAPDISADAACCKSSDEGGTLTSKIEI